MLLKMKPANQRLVLAAMISPALLVGVVLLFLVAERVRGKILLSNYRKALVAQGEKIKASDFVTQPDPELNGALLLQAAAEQIGRRGVVADRMPGCMALTSSGRAEVSFRKVEWMDDGVFYNWDQVEEELKDLAPVIEQARGALRMPILDNQLDYGAGHKLLLPHLTKSKNLVRVFGASAQLALHRGSTAAATDHLVVQVELLRALQQDRLLISGLVRNAIAAIAFVHTWEALQADGWADADLARLAAAWKEPPFIAAMTQALEGERMYIAATYDALRESNDEAAVLIAFAMDTGNSLDTSGPWWTTWILSDLAPVVDFLRDQVYCRLWRFSWIDQDEYRYTRNLQRLLELSRAAVRDRSGVRLQSEASSVVEEAMPRNLYDRVRMPTINWFEVFPRAMGRSMRLETERSLALAAIALKRYELRTGTHPDSLETLVPEFLDSIPTDYMNGQPLRYRLNPDGAFLLYSVGEDGKDNGGDMSIQPDSHNFRTIWTRLDAVWPGED
jgi:hypothetical protein